jgi:membrane protease YdiL (CAAX protease family)
LNYGAAMRALALFLAAIVATLLLAAPLAYPLFALLHPLNPAWPFHKIAERLWQLLMLAGLALVVARLRLTSRADWGYGAPRPVFIRQCLAGFALGIVSMLPVSAVLIAMGIRPLLPDLSLARVGALVLAGLGSGLAVGVVEETFYRGLMQGAAVRELRARGRAVLPAVAAVALIYAALHFPARETIPNQLVNAASGFRMLAAVGAKFADFSSIADSFLALTAVGLLLGLAREFTGSIAVGIGLHAGWVAVMRLTIGATRLNPDSPYRALVSASDGYTGWLVLAVTVAITVALLAARRALVAWRDPGVSLRSP